MSIWRVGLVFNGTRQWINVEAADIHEAAERGPGAMAEYRVRERLSEISTPVEVVSAERTDR